MEYLTSAECAEKWNVSQRWVAIYCKEGRIEGAIQKGRMICFLTKICPKRTSRKSRRLL